MRIKFTLNKKEYSLDVDSRKSLLEMVREDIELTGAKQGCGVGECGACTMIVDDEIINACLYLAVWVDGRSVTTIEGLAKDGLSPVQQSFIDHGAVQCGFCTPGMVLAATNLLELNPNPTRAEVKRGLSGNLCRCTGYQKIVDAVLDV